MINTEDAETGDMVGRKPATTPEDVLDAFDDRDDLAEPLTAPELADALNCSRRTALNKLHTLAEDGDVNSKQVGGRAKVWWRPLTREPRETPAHDDADAVGADDDRGEAPRTPDADTGTHGDERSGDDPIGDVLDGWEPDTEADATTARAQTRRAVEWLRADGGRRTKSDFVDALAGDAALADRTWWERAVQPGLRRFRDADLVEYQAGHHDYRWVGDATAAERERGRA